ncbi:MAG TPA: hypothetical protein VK969_02900 [Acidimicrobiia bacterium]|nr:hypothetical protein [Acidimicrobiia bacterium]
MSYSLLVAVGAGLVGSEPTRALLHDPDIDRVTIGGLDMSKAKVCWLANSTPSGIGGRKWTSETPPPASSRRETTISQ